MTTIGPRALQRETYATVHELRKTRPVIVTIEYPSLVGFRLKGTRRTYRLPADYLYWHAIKKHVEAERSEKKRKRDAGAP